MIELQDYEIDQVGGGVRVVVMVGRAIWSRIGDISRLKFIVDTVAAAAEPWEDHPTNAYATAKIGVPLN